MTILFQLRAVLQWPTTHRRQDTIYASSKSSGRAREPVSRLEGSSASALVATLTLVWLSWVVDGPGSWAAAGLGRDVCYRPEATAQVHCQEQNWRRLTKKQFGQLRPKYFECEIEKQRQDHERPHHMSCRPRCRLLDEMTSAEV